jgi:zinc and cadmium transporter
MEISNAFYAILSACLVSALSFIGIFLLFFKLDKMNVILNLLMCFAIGTLLGNAFFQLIPESYFHIESARTTSWLILGGFFVFFIIEQTLHISHGNRKTIKPYGYLSLYADGIHNFVDGILIGATWMFSHELGLATTLAIILHEIPQEISDFGILIRAGFNKRKALLFNFISACTAILGTAITLWIGQQVNHFSIYMLPVAAGGFIYLATGCLIPEILQGPNKNNLWKYSFIILLGLFFMYYLTLHNGHSH